MYRKGFKIETYWQWKTNRKSYVAYRIAPMPVTLSDHEGQFFSLKSFEVTYVGKCSVY